MKRVFNVSVLLFAVMLLCSSDVLNYTRLTIVVIDHVGNHVEGATVKLFDNKADFDKLENEVKVGVSNHKGKVYFKELQPREYYVYAEKGDFNNVGHGEKTSVLVENHHNKANVIISE